MPAVTLLRCIAFAWCLTCAATTHVAATTASAPVWRCPEPSGTSITYQARPCHGQGHPLPASVDPSAEAREASAEVAAREAQLAETMRRQRIGREQGASPVHTSLSGPVRQVSVNQPDRDQPGTHKRTKRRARVQQKDIFRAEVPGRARSRPNLTRQAAGASTSSP